MILFASGRCDIPAYFSKWFLHRLKEGYVDVRNPYQSTQISRILLDHNHIDCIVFCTKNPIPLLNHLHEIPFPYLFHITLTPYHQDIEPHVPDKKLILSAIQTLSKTLGKEKVIVRYDPIILTPRYTIAYHKKAFESLCKQLYLYIDTIIISFVDEYQNMRKHAPSIKMHTLNEAAMIEVGKTFGEIANSYRIKLQTCAESIDLSAYGIQSFPCFDEDDLNKRLHTSITFQKGNSVRSNCHCLPTVDIGDYNACMHFCRYCYANYDETKIKQQFKLHDPTSSILIGHVNEHDSITIRKK